jgi:hypothetical protein
MNLYHLWFNLKPGIKELQFCDAVDKYLGFLKEKEQIAGWRLTRRKLGFGPPTLGEWHIMIECKDMVQLEAAFNHVATRTGEVEKLHAPVYSSVCDATFALYRDYPDEVRSKS